MKKCENPLCDVFFESVGKKRFCSKKCSMHVWHKETEKGRANQGRGLANLTPEHRARSQEKAVRRRYASGKLPSWMYS